MTGDGGEQKRGSALKKGGGGGERHVSSVFFERSGVPAHAADGVERRQDDDVEQAERLM